MQSLHDLNHLEIICWNCNNVYEIEKMVIFILIFYFRNTFQALVHYLNKISELIHA